MNTIHPTYRLILIGLLLAGIFIIDILIPLGVAGGVPYVAVILLSLRFHQERITVVMAVLATVLTVLAFFFSPSGGEFWKVLSNRALALFVIWVTAILGQQLKEAVRKQRETTIEKEIALKELHTLRGLLPICSHCKNIRDEKGNWTQLEMYLDEHSDAEFSHGVCPECAAKYYPGIKYTSSE